MSVSKWNYEPEKCEGQPCVGDCDFCNIELIEWEIECDENNDMREG